MLQSDQQNELFEVPNQFDKCNKHITSQKPIITIQKTQIDRKLTHGMSNYQEIKLAHTKNNTKRTPHIIHNQNCTFQPKVTSKDKKATHRSFEKFIEDQKQFLQKKQAKIQQKKLQHYKEQAESITGRPSIDRNSQKISTTLSRQSNQVFKRLSKQKKIVKENQAQQTFFQPKILNYSKDMIRTHNVSNLLYEDAKRRAQKDKLIQSTMKQKLNAIPFINSNSNNLVKKKLWHQFQQFVKTEQISAAQALEVLCLVFHMDLPSPQICQEILCYICSKQHQDLIKKKKLWKFIQIIIGVCQNSQFTQQEAQRIYQNYACFYLNRLSRQKKKVKILNECSFKPKTLRSSSHLAEKHREKMLTDISEFVSTQNIKIDPLESMRIEDLFIMDYLKKKNSYERLKVSKEINQLKQCSFRPEVNTKFNQRIEAKVTKRSIERVIPKNQSKENFINKENEISKTSVQRSIQRSQKKHKKLINSKQNVQVKNMDKEILRMSLGRKNREYINLMKEQREYPKVNDWETFRKQQRKQIQSINCSNKNYQSKVF